MTISGKGKVKSCAPHKEGLQEVRPTFGKICTVTVGKKEKVKKNGFFICPSISDT
jgi:hypothetical protein